jgi:hypothetical protein
MLEARGRKVDMGSKKRQHMRAQKGHLRKERRRRQIDHQARTGSTSSLHSQVTSGATPHPSGYNPLDYGIFLSAQPLSIEESCKEWSDFHDIYEPIKEDATWGREEFLKLPWVQEYASESDSGHAFREYMVVAYDEDIPVASAYIEYIASVPICQILTDNRNCAYVAPHHICDFTGIRDFRAAVIALHEDGWLVPVSDEPLFIAPGLVLKEKWAGESSSFPVAAFEYELAPAVEPLTLELLQDSPHHYASGGSGMGMLLGKKFWSQEDFFSLRWIKEFLETCREECESDRAQFDEISSIARRFGDAIPAGHAVVDINAVAFLGLETSNSHFTNISASSICKFAGKHNIKDALNELYGKGKIIALDDGFIVAPELMLRVPKRESLIH